MAAKSAITRAGAIGFYVALQGELEGIASGISDEVDQVLREETEKIADAARQKVPVDSGNLRDSIEVVEDGRPGYSGYRVVADARSTSGRYRVPYAHMVEYGSVHNKPAQPFLTPALEESRQGILDAVNAKLEEVVNQ